MCTTRVWVIIIWLSLLLAMSTVLARFAFELDEPNHGKRNGSKQHSYDCNGEDGFNECQAAAAPDRNMRARHGDTSLDDSSAVGSCLA